MRLNVKVKKTSHYKKKIQALQKKLSQAHNNSIYIGYTLDQGVHEDSKLTYVDLMTIHEYGAPKANIPARPVLTLTKNGGVLTAVDVKAIAAAFRGVFVKNIPLETAYNKVGEYYRDKAFGIFGSTYLAPTVKGNAPLIGTTEALSKNISYRTTFTYTRS